MAKEPFPILGYRAISSWYRALPEEDQREISKAVKKQQDELYNLKGKTDGAPVHDNRN